ncbi:hypothetical protein GCM10010339_59960 [Streptomyces alanosinicus]|uniref:Uncharacterized protein n=1 Tax=Streptomyces alanosinicus TaxID=68171 RepID=A0A919D482_9ACTN|nr:hypothetical protein GCM10010339_59960 [Streptomyces alanosinicus]
MLPAEFLELVYGIVLRVIELVFVVVGLVVEGVVEVVLGHVAVGVGLRLRGNVGLVLIDLVLVGSLEVPVENGFDLVGGVLEADRGAQLREREPGRICLLRVDLDQPRPVALSRRADVGVARPVTRVSSWISQRHAVGMG